MRQTILFIMYLGVLASCGQQDNANNQGTISINQSAAGINQATINNGKSTTGNEKAAKKSSESKQDASQKIQITGAYIREPVARNTTAVAFFSINNPTSTNYRLLGASSNAAKVGEIHEHSHSNGQMKMRQLDYVDIAANSTVEFAPGGLHIMLFDFSNSTDKKNTDSSSQGKEQDATPSATLTLEFDNKQSVSVTANIRSVLD